MQSTRYSCRISMKLEFSRQIFEESLIITFYQNSSSESRVVLRGQTEGRTDRQTDSHEEANSRFSQFCEGTEIYVKGFVNGIYNCKNQ